MRSFCKRVWRWCKKAGSCYENLAVLGMCAGARSPIYPLPSSAFPHPRIDQIPYLAGVFDEECECQLFSAQRDETITLMHDVNR